VKEWTLTKISGARTLVESLRREAVTVVFGFPGGFNMPIYDALYDERSRSGKQIRHILVRHEQSAVHMADGYARASGNVGVCLATSGPGATNLLTGLATAYHDSSPLVAITGQVPTFSVGSDAFQEADIIGMAASITKYSFQPLNVKELPHAVRSAFHLAASAPTKPILIDVPRNVQTDEGEIDWATDSGSHAPNIPPLAKVVPSVKTEQEAAESHLTSAISLLGPLLPPNALVTADVPFTYAAREGDQVEHRTSIGSNLATMGFGFPAALGAKVARPQAHVIAIEDNVGFLMTENSLATSLEEQIPVTVVVLSKPLPWKVAMLQKRFKDKWNAGIKTTDQTPNIVKLAESYGARGVHAETLDDLGRAVTKAIKSSVTTVVDGMNVKF
jgi:thiamine pyrophosphate-dependent acetolactate synthase large subunit-like protein